MTRQPFLAKRWMRSLTTGLLVTALLLGVIEAGFRVYAWVSGTVFFPEWAVFDPELGYRLQPGFTQPNKGIRINRFGFRGTEPLQRPGIKTVIFLGDSCVRPPSAAAPGPSAQRGGRRVWYRPSAEGLADPRDWAPS